MSRQSKKQGRPSVPRDVESFKAAVAARLRVLQQCGAAYDAGQAEQVLVLAGTLRLLLDDDPPLLERVTRLRGLRFTDTASYDPMAVAGYGLTRTSAVAGQPGTAKLRAPLGDGLADPAPTAVFREWWQRNPAVQASQFNWYTRQFVVCEMANTDGVHVDSELDLEFHGLSTDHQNGFTLDGYEVEGNLASECVRQIAWEVEHTLLRALPEIVQPRGDGHLR